MNGLIIYLSNLGVIMSKQDLIKKYKDLIEYASTLYLDERQAKAVVDILRVVIEDLEKLDDYIAEKEKK